MTPILSQPQPVAVYAKWSTFRWCQRYLGCNVYAQQDGKVPHNLSRVLVAMAIYAANKSHTIPGCHAGNRAQLEAVFYVHWNFIICVASTHPLNWVEFFGSIVTPQMMKCDLNEYKTCFIYIKKIICRCTYSNKREHLWIMIFWEIS